MENNNIFSSSETVADLSATMNHTDAAHPKRKPVSLFIVLGVIILIGAGIATYFLLNRSSAPAVDEDGVPLPETVYATPEGSEDAEGDYLKYLEKQKSSAKTPDEALSVTIDEFNLKIMLEKFDEAADTLATVDESSLTDSGKYQLYSAYMRLYSESALNDPAQLAEYTSKAETQYKIITGEIDYGE